jgi:hypothetical protein
MRAMMAWTAWVTLLVALTHGSAFHIRDDFDTRSDRWLWIEEGAGARIAVGGGICTLQVRDPAVGGYCNAELVNKEGERYRYGSLEVRCRTSGMRPGSRGWGWWDRHKHQLITDFDVAWVMQSKDYSDNASTNWLDWGHCAGAMDRRLWWDVSAVVDPRRWHTYRIDWTPASISLFIDDVLFRSTSDQVPDAPMSIDIWVDNQPVGRSGPTFQYYGWSGTSRVLVDYVEMSAQRVRAGKQGKQRMHRGGAETITVVDAHGRAHELALPRGFGRGTCEGYTVDGRRLFVDRPIASGHTLYLERPTAGVVVLRFRSSSVHETVRLALP